MRGLRAIALLALASAGFGACRGDGDVVLPSDAKPKPPATTVQHLTCAQILATTTTSASSAELVICAEREAWHAVRDLRRSTE